MEVVSIDIPELGNRSYLVHDGTVAVVFDPSRRIQQVIDVATQHGVTIKAVFETHIHNDYVTGGYALAQKLGVAYYVSAQEEAEFTHEKIDAEEVVAIGQLKVTALASPGHTHHHLSYLVERPDMTAALFSGGSLLYGAVGRPDLISAKATPALAKAQYQTAQFFAQRLDPSTLLYPTHGFGSFCAATETEHVAVSTIKQQLKSNQAYLTKNETAFVEDLLAHLDAYPAYYSYMAPANLKGPSDYQNAVPALLTKEALMSAMHTGAAVVDMRSRKAYAAKHMPGTYNIEQGDDLATYIGWIVAWEAPLILVASSAEEVANAQEQLALIGREIVAGQMRPDDLLDVPSLAGSYPVRSFTDLADVISKEDVTVVDVRRRLEWQKGHIPQAVHIPLHELTARLSEIADDKEIWVYCALGFRASIAASILAGNNKRPVLIDDAYSNVVKVGLLPVEKKRFVDDVASGDAQLLDVRDNSEWKAERAKGAIHIPLGRLLDGDTEPLAEDKPVYIYCATGDRSGMAESFLNAYDFRCIDIGGLSDWVQAGGAVEN